MAIQAVVFNKKGFSKDEAYEWLQKHSLKPQSKTPKVTEKYLKYDIVKKNNKKRRIRSVHLWPGISFILMF